MKSEHEKQTAFLRQCLAYDDSVERQELVEHITRLQQNERCVHRASWFMVVLAALAVAGLCYSAVLLEQYPGNFSAFMSHVTLKALCVLGLGSGICSLSFVALGAAYRKELNQQREECRRLATTMMKSRLGESSGVSAASSSVS